MRIRKLKEEWKPSENISLQVGEIIDISDPKALVEQGLAIYVDADGDDWERYPIAWSYRPKTEEQKKNEVDPIEVEKAHKAVVKLKKQEQARKMREIQAIKRADRKREIEIEKKEKMLKEQEDKAQKALEEAMKVVNEQPL